MITMADEKKAPVKKAAKKTTQQSVEKKDAPATEKTVAQSTFRTHGRTFTGKVVSDKMHRTVTVQWERRHYVPKYQRYQRRYSKVKAHNPDEIDAKVGDIVTVMETKPISKTKNFVVIKKN